MYLKEIRAYGFKSFADKTTIEFGKNINGIVGPNGSGKSNIVDAVRWVLGEQSMKSLRGDNSLDVIFSGSESRRALNSASVSLVFDNEDKTLPINFNEVSIKRMAFRTGENEYYINNERVRLKDITDLLTDSGTAKESFNIISQGKIDEILSKREEDRRVIFEEAAGVLKYKRRKEEALRKLDKTNQNLNRVNDIINEISTTIVPLEEASSKAKRYIEIKDRLSNIEVAVIAKTISDLNFEYKEDKKKIEEIENEIAKLSVSNSAYDVDILKYKDRLRTLREDINNKQTLLIELSKNEEKITSSIKILQERNKYSGETSKISNNIISLKEEILNITSSLKSQINDKEVIDKKIEILNDNIERLLRFLEKRSNITSYLSISELLDNLLNYKLTNLILKKCKISGDKLYRELSSQDKDNLCECLLKFKIKAVGTNDFTNAQTCSGGIPLKEVNENFESKLIPNLYLTGEVIDVSGDCGGYNIGFAALSGIIAGISCGGSDD